jgi:hypothetical protein
MVKLLCSRPLRVSPWDSALQDCRPLRHKLMKLYIEQMPKAGRIVLAGDHTAWPRPDAVTDPKCKMVSLKPLLELYG